MKLLLKKICIISIILLVIVSCSQLNTTTETSNSGQETTDQEQCSYLTTTTVQQGEDLKIEKPYIKEKKLFITAVSTVNSKSLAVYLRLRVLTSDGTLLTQGPSGWIMKQQLTHGKGVVMTFELEVPDTDVITIEGLESINIDGVIEDHSTIVKAYLK